MPATGFSEAGSKPRVFSGWDTGICIRLRGSLFRKANWIFDCPREIETKDFWDFLPSSATNRLYKPGNCFGHSNAKLRGALKIFNSTMLNFAATCWNSQTDIIGNSQLTLRQLNPWFKGKRKRMKNRGKSNFSNGEQRTHISVWWRWRNHESAEMFRRDTKGKKKWPC